MCGCGPFGSAADADPLLSDVNDNGGTFGFCGCVMGGSSSCSKLHLELWASKYMQVVVAAKLPAGWVSACASFSSLSTPSACGATTSISSEKIRSPIPLRPWLAYVPSQVAPSCGLTVHCANVAFRLCRGELELDACETSSCATGASPTPEDSHTCFWSVTASLGDTDDIVDDTGPSCRGD